MRINELIAIRPAWGKRMRRRTILRAGAAGLLAGVAVGRRARAKVTATFASVNTPAYINPRMQMRFIDEVRQRSKSDIDIHWVGSGQLGGP
jgi:TRAP-type C4-dicarboxylate transport system substrate-binding protein